MDDGGGGASGGDLVVGVGVRASGAGGVVGGFGVVCGGWWSGCERGGWVGVAETVSRVACWGEVAWLVGGGMVKGCRVAVAGHRVSGGAWSGKGVESRGVLGLGVGMVVVGVQARQAEVSRCSRGSAGSGRVGEGPVWSGVVSGSAPAGSGCRTLPSRAADGFGCYLDQPRRAGWVADVPPHRWPRSLRRGHRRAASRGGGAICAPP